jgi:hypothetical protein
MILLFAYITLGEPVVAVAVFTLSGVTTIATPEPPTPEPPNPPPPVFVVPFAIALPPGQVSLYELVKYGAPGPAPPAPKAGLVKLVHSAGDKPYAPPAPYAPEIAPPLQVPPPPPA